MTIGSRIKQFAKDNFGSLNELSRATGINVNLLSQYTTDRSKPGADILIKLHTAGCDINWLLSGEQTELESLRKENQFYKERFEQIKALAESMANGTFVPPINISDEAGKG